MKHHNGFVDIFNMKSFWAFWKCLLNVDTFKILFHCYCYSLPVFFFRFLVFCSEIITTNFISDSNTIISSHLAT